MKGRGAISRMRAVLPRQPHPRVDARGRECNPPNGLILPAPAGGSAGSRRRACWGTTRTSTSKGSCPAGCRRSPF